MRDLIQARLEALKKELEKGQAELQKVEAQRTYLQEMVLRISGAVEVLEAVLAEGGSAAGQAAPDEQPSATANGNGANA